MNLNLGNVEIRENKRTWKDWIPSKQQFGKFLLIAGKLLMVAGFLYGIVTNIYWLVDNVTSIIENIANKHYWDAAWSIVTFSFRGILRFLWIALCMLPGLIIGITGSMMKK